jgi:hypothetical protein
MISGMRDQVLALACLRHGAPVAEGRGIDAMPPEAAAAVAAGLVRSLDAAELRRAFGVVTDALIAEVGRADADLADRLSAPLKELAGRDRRASS